MTVKSGLVIPIGRIVWIAIATIGLVAATEAESEMPSHCPWRVDRMNRPLLTEVADWSSCQEHEPTRAIAGFFSQESVEDVAREPYFDRMARPLPFEASPATWADVDRTPADRTDFESRSPTICLWCVDRSGRPQPFQKIN